MCEDTDKLAVIPTYKTNFILYLSCFYWRIPLCISFYELNLLAVSYTSIIHSVWSRSPVPFPSRKLTPYPFPDNLPQSHFSGLFVWLADFLFVCFYWVWSRQLVVLINWYRSNDSSFPRIYRLPMAAQWEIGRPQPLLNPYLNSEASVLLRLSIGNCSSHEFRMALGALLSVLCLLYSLCPLSHRVLYTVITMSCLKMKHNLFLLLSILAVIAFWSHHYLLQRETFFFYSVRV